MKKIACLFLCLLMLLSATACSSALQSLTETKTGESTVQDGEQNAQTATQGGEQTATQSTPAVPSKVKITTGWDQINALPIAKAGMSEAELRQLCIDFFRLTQTVCWTPAKDYQYKIQDTTVTFKAGQVYAGIPYVAENAGGSFYSFLRYYNAETGVLDLGNVASSNLIPKLGTHCSSGAFWGWARVVNSVPERYLTAYYHQAKGFLRVGSYQYIGFEDATSWDQDQNTTTNCCKKNGEQVMYESYAQMKPADGMLLVMKSGKHVRMNVSVHVVRDGNGKIDPNKSYTTYLDQGSSWDPMLIEGQGQVLVQGGVDAKNTFKELYSKGYVPFTFKEFCGQDPIEKGEAKLDVEGTILSSKTLQTATLTTNYFIGEIRIKTYDAGGKETHSRTVTAGDTFCIKTTSLAQLLSSLATRKAAEAADRTVIEVYLANGETVTAFDGKVTA